MAWKSALNILHVWCYEWPDICRSAHAPVTLVTSCNHRGFRRCRSQMKVTRRWNGRIINKWGIVHCHVCWRVYFIPLVGVFIHFAATLSFTFGITIAVEQLCNYVYDCICNYVIHIITYTHINYYIQLCDTFKPPISTGVLVVPGGTLILLKNRKAADGQDNFSESEREREREKFRVAGSVWCSRILWILWMQATVSLWTLACSSAC